jgi:hypothetical protein
LKGRRNGTIQVLSQYLSGEIKGVCTYAELIITRFFSTMATLTLGITHPPIQLVPGAVSLGVKRTERESDQSPPSIGDVKNGAAVSSRIKRPGREAEH